MCVFVFVCVREASSYRSTVGWKKKQYNISLYQQPYIHIHTRARTHRLHPGPDAADIDRPILADSVGDAPLLAQQDGHGDEEGAKHGEGPFQGAARAGPAVRPQQGADGGRLWCV